MVVVVVMVEGVWVPRWCGGTILGHTRDRRHTGYVHIHTHTHIHRLYTGGVGVGGGGARGGRCRRVVWAAPHSVDSVMGGSVARWVAAARPSVAVEQGARPPPRRLLPPPGTSLC